MKKGGVRLETISKTVVALVRNEETKGRTFIWLKSGRYMSVQQDPDRLLDHTLQLLGSNLKARRAAGKQLLQCKQFTPILIDEQLKIVFFPLHKQTEYDRYYINSHYYLQALGTPTTIHFTTGLTLKVKQTAAFIERQHAKSLCMIDSQTKIKETQLNYEY